MENAKDRQNLWLYCKKIKNEIHAHGNISVAYGEDNVNILAD